LEKLLNKTIFDPVIIDIYWQMVKLGYVGTDLNLKKYNSNITFFEHLKFNSLLSNIYLHDFDVFMEEEIEKRNLKLDEVSRQPSWVYTLFQLEKKRKKELDLLSSIKTDNLIGVDFEK